MRSLLTNIVSSQTQRHLSSATSSLAKVYERLSSAAGELGSSVSRLNVTLNVLRQRRENTEAAASQILSADVADEAAHLTRLNILQQAATAVLEQPDFWSRVPLSPLWFV